MLLRFLPRVLCLVCASLSLGTWQLSADEYDASVAAALEKSAGNRPQIEAALSQVAEDQSQGMRFLVANMPARDLTSLTAEYLLKNCDLAYREWLASPWHDQVPTEIFLNNILPYASINERRDAWREDFIDRFKPLVQDAKSPGQAAAILNQKVFEIVKVRYSTNRPKADQSPYESIQAGLASCSGLSVLLIDACRAVGVPARFAGTALWSNNSGNHSWVEVWDDGWHFTGAAEPAGDKLDEAWFIGNAASAKRDHPWHAIYAVSFQKTPEKFPLVWDPSIDYVHAVNVTDRYTARAEPLAEGMGRVMFRVLAANSRERCAAQLVVRDADSNVIWQGTSKDERFDANDHVTLVVRQDVNYQVQARFNEQSATRSFQYHPESPLVEIQLETLGADNALLAELRTYLAQSPETRAGLADQHFARQPLSRAEAELARNMLWEDRLQTLRRERAAELESRKLVIGDLAMPFDVRTFGEAPATGRSLYISMHGGGGAPKEVNDQQWENQKRLYEPAEGLYVAPRAPTDTWNMWHQAHIDQFHERLIEDLVALENVDPNRVYIMGYSAGGDGVFQLAPRIADRLAAAAMMAGHPNESSPLGLRNLPFTMHVGGLDSAYGRNQVAADWAKKLDDLQQADPEGYEHWAKIYPDKGHWLDRLDAAAVPWMARFQRHPSPRRVVWYQDDVVKGRFYWLAIDEDQRKAGTRITATLAAQQVELDVDGVTSVRVRWNDQLVDLDQPVRIVAQGKQLWEGRVERTIAMLAQTLAEHGDPDLVYSAETSVNVSDQNAK